MTPEVERIFHFLNGGQKLFGWKDRTLTALELQKIRSYCLISCVVLQKVLIETTSLSRSTVQRVMKELIEKGYLERIGSKNLAVGL